MRLSVLVSVFFLTISASQAAERRLAADSDFTLTIGDKYRCGTIAPITITAPSAEYFDKEAQTVQRLANTVRAVLGFECSDIPELEFIGRTDGVLVFQASAKKADNWLLLSDPAPLEGLALVYSLYQPEFFHLGTVSEQLQPYIKVSGIFKTDQFLAYERQAKRLMPIVDGDTEKFKNYLKSPGRKFPSFENLLTHYEHILKTIKVYAPQHHAAYEAVYKEVSASLKNDYWSAQVASLDVDDSIADFIAKANTLTKDTSSSEFISFVDRHVLSLAQGQVNLIEPTLEDSTLAELANAADLVSALPNSSKVSKFPKTQTYLQETADRFTPLLMGRASDLETLAEATIQEAGMDYSEIDSILETGFALAEEFEEAGYPEAAENLLVNTYAHIDSVLKSGLQNYKNELSNIKIAGEYATALQEQLIVFEEMSEEFEGFSAYKEIAEEALKGNKSEICKGLLKDAKVSRFDYNKRIHLGGDHTTLANLACDLYEFEHVISEFKWAFRPGVFTLAIDQADGTQSRFRLNADNIFTGQGLIATSRFDEGGNVTISPDEWKNYIAKLVLPPPSGKPDIKGVRECDTLAADPHDAQKLATGVDFEKDEVDPNLFDRAIDACIAAVENDDQDVRQQFQLGRLLWFAGDQEIASEYIDLAAAAKYPPAIYYKAEILLGTSEDPDAFIDALDMFEAAGKSGYERGNVMLKELNPDGIDFFKESPPPSPQNIMSTLKATSSSASLLGITSWARVTGINIKSCFQLSATDHSCEYKKVLKCGMNGSGLMGQLMSAALQSDCNTVYPKFGTFRKLGNGKWRELPSRN